MKKFTFILPFLFTCLGAFAQNSPVIYGVNGGGSPCAYNLISGACLSGTGTVTSVTATVPAYMSISGSPVTTTGTLGFDFGAQSGNKVFSSPSNGTSGAMSMRALVLADIPGSIPASKLVGTDIASVGTITAGTWTGTTIALANGGTGQTSKAAAFDALQPMSASGDIIYGGASGTGTRLAKGADGTVLTLASGVPSWAAAAGGSTPTSGADIENCTVTSSVGSNALTFSLKQADGSTDPAAGSGACLISFRNATAATPSYTQVSTAAALSTVVSSGSTLGCISATDCYIYVYALNNAGTVELAYDNGHLFDMGNLQTTVAEGGAGAALLGNTLYSTTARSGVAIRALARFKIQEATAGTWATDAATKSPWPFKPLKWSVDITQDGAVPTLSNTAVSNSDMSAAMTLHQTPGLNRQIGWATCTTTNSSTGITCGAGTMDVGVSFIMPEPGNVMVCFTVESEIQTNNTAQQTNMVFNMVETPINAQTITQNTQLQSVHFTGQGSAILFEVQVTSCGIVGFNTNGRKALRLFYTLTNSNSGALNYNAIQTSFMPTHLTIQSVD